MGSGGSKKEEATKIKVYRESLKYLYLFKAETNRRLYEILNTIIKYAYENEQVRREIIRLLASKQE